MGLQVCYFYCTKFDSLTSRKIFDDFVRDRRNRRKPRGRLTNSSLELFFGTLLDASQNQQSLTLKSNKATFYGMANQIK